MIRVEKLTPAFGRRYQTFLRSDPTCLIYASLEFRDFLLKAVGGTSTVLMALDERDQIVGTLCYFSFHVPALGTVINSLPWYGSHGSCIVRGNFPNEVRCALITRFREIAEQPDVLSATVILTPDEENKKDEYLRILQPDALDHRVGQVTELPEVGEHLERHILQKTRNLVRKALRQSFVLTVEDGEAAWQFLYQTHAENMTAIGGKAKPLSHFQVLQSVFPASARRLYVAHLNGQPVAALLLLYFNHTVEYITPVVKLEYRSAQPLSFLIWHAMQDAITSGFRRWNWGGTWTSQKSLHHFKAGWGAEDKPYTYLISSSKRGREVFVANKEKLHELFPYYYTYPYDRL